MTKIIILLTLLLNISTMFSQAYDPTVCDLENETAVWRLERIFGEDMELLSGCPDDPDCVVKVTYYKRTRNVRGITKFDFQIEKIESFNCESCNLDLYEIALHMIFRRNRILMGLVVEGACQDEFILHSAACWEETTSGTHGGNIEISSCNTECCRSRYKVCLVDNNGVLSVSFNLEEDFSNVTDNCISPCEFIDCSNIHPFFQDQPIDIGEIHDTYPDFGKKTTDYQNENIVTITPNPIDDYMLLKVHNDEIGVIELELFNVNGELIHNITFNKQNSMFNKEIELPFSYKGLINYRLKLNGKHYSGSIIKN